MLNGFKEFLSRGNIVDLSIAVVIGTAFTALVTAFTNSIVDAADQSHWCREKLEVRHPENRHRWRPSH